MLVSGKMDLKKADLKANKITRKRGHYIMTKGEFAEMTQQS